MNVESKLSIGNRALVFVDCEAPYGCRSPATGDMTEFGAVELTSRSSFRGIGCSAVVMDEFALWLNDSFDGRRPVFVSDNPAYDWQWINYYFDKYGMTNPFGHSARRIGDFYAGLVCDFWRSSEWKSLRVTRHDHDPVNDAAGNAEAFVRMIAGERGQRIRQ